MNIMSIIAWTLLHFIWQGTAVALFLSLLLRLVRHESSLLRYSASVAALVLVVLFPIFTAVRLAQGTPLPLGLRSLESPTTIGRGTDVANMTVQASGPATINSGEAIVSAPLVDVSVRRLAWKPSAVTSLRTWGDAAAPFLVVAWLTGVLVLSIRFFGGWLQVRTLTRTGITPVNADRGLRLARLADQLGLSRSVQLLESALVQVPTVVGWLRPVLLMPLSLETGLSTRELELLFAHELAHIRRHDYLINLLQTVVETVLFYHPGVWWISKQIRQEREHCCDDIAVALCEDRSAYAKALLRLEELRQRQPQLAVAANGGSLLRRIRRLLSVPPSHAESRGRWAAIPLGVAALIGIVSGTGAAKSAVFPKRLEISVPQREVASDTLRSRSTRDMKPDTVIRYDGPTATLAARWEWATAAARRAGRKDFWIGYTINGDDSRGWVYMDRHVPIYTPHGTMMGSMHFKNGGEGLSFTGARMDSLVGPHAPEDQVVLFGFVVRDGRAEMDRLHASTFVLPVHFAGRSLLWLGKADDRESIELTRRLFAATRNSDIKRELVEVVALHRDDVPVMAALRTWLEGKESDDIRAEAAEALGDVSTPAALALAARTARTDRSRRVRREAAEALGELGLAEATDTLIALVHSADDTDVRKEAIETLGERHEPRAFDALVRIAWEDPATDLQREAVETLAETEDERALGELERIARSHPKSEVRQEAVETLGELERPAEVVPILRDIVDRDVSSNVRQEAVETLGEVKDSRAFGILSELARTHRDADVRHKALESLADHGEKEAVIAILDKLIESGSSERDQVAAVEALGNVEDERAVEKLERVAMKHPDQRVQHAAVEGLGNVAPHEKAWDALNRLIWQGTSEEVSKTAVETLGSIEHEGRPAVFAKIAATHPRTSVRRAAIEQLGNLDDSADARAELARIARSDADEETRKDALEAYADAASPADIVAFMSDRVKNDKSFDVQRRALEALGDLEHHEGTPALIQFARSHPNVDLRKRAIEMLGDSDDPRAHAELARILQGNGKPR
ncbi:MAG: HEAT repeat domain-containing protein, partial [Gemmatimonadaceae bacterium]